MQIIDKKILAASSQHLVLTESAGVSFADLSSLDLHRVDTSSGLTTPYLRAVHEGPGVLLIFDVRDVAHGLRDTLKAAPARDAQGLIYYALRQAYDTALVALSAIKDHAIDTITVKTAEVAA